MKTYRRLQTLNFLHGFSHVNKINKYIHVSSTYNKVVISICLLACLIITHEPLDRFASNFNQGRTTGMFLAWFKTFKLRIGRFQANLFNIWKYQTFLIYYTFLLLFIILFIQIYQIRKTKIFSILCCKFVSCF